MICVGRTSAAPRPHGGRRCAEYLDLDIKGVISFDNFQGQEANVVIVSLVGNNDQGRLGFVDDYRRINVLLSRAKCNLFVVGRLAMMSQA